MATAYALQLFGHHDSPLVKPPKVKVIVPNQPKVYELMFPVMFNSQKEFGSVLESNKRILNQAIARVNVAPERRALLVAMAMQETNCMSESERDWTKDRKDPGAVNFSIFNLNADFIQQVTGAAAGTSLNKTANLADAVKIIDTAIDMKPHQWQVKPKHAGVRAVLDFVRGGRTAFTDGEYGNARLYRRAIKTILSRFDGEPSLLSDRRRVWIDVPWI